MWLKKLGDQGSNRSKVKYNVQVYSATNQCMVKYKQVLMFQVYFDFVLDSAFQVIWTVSS